MSTSLRFVLVTSLPLLASACAHTELPAVQTAPLAPPPAPSDPAAPAPPDPVAPPPAPPDPAAPVAVGFIGDPGMSHVELGLVLWHGGRRDDQHVVHAGRYINSCGEETYRQVFHHGPIPPVILGLGCDHSIVAQTPGIDLVEVVREPAAVVVQTTGMMHGHPGAWHEVARVAVPAGVPVTAATDAQVRDAQDNITNW